jgi:probable aminopeptidase NPEPL1
MTNSLTFVSNPEQLKQVGTMLVIGRKKRLLEDDIRQFLPESLSSGIWNTMVTRNEPGDSGRAITTYTGGRPIKVVAGLLPEVCSRHNSPSRSWAVPKLVAAARQKGTLGIVIATDDTQHLFALAMAAARAWPTYSATSRNVARSASVLLMGPNGPMREVEAISVAAEGVREAAMMVDRPPTEWNVDDFVLAAENVRDDHQVDLTVIRGKDLQAHGLGGIYGVGKAAMQPPALIVLHHDPGKSPHHVAWVGKGIVYDTGGLSLKGKNSMPGMKTDMGGAAAVLAAFRAAVSIGVPHRLTAVLCVAENAIGPQATRPDDILTMYSGCTVEVNNTDAEGRLVLADGVAWVIKNRQPDEIVDLATLTGAQSVSTGRRHAALYCSDEALEQRAIIAGRASGDLAHALPYCPEFFRAEFTSRVADMRNSVKNRSNAQSSCAGQFIRNHMDGWAGPWLHVDMAGPSTSNGRGTGYGVSLLLTLVGLGAPT